MKFQFVWWFPDWKGFKFGRFSRHWREIYDWYLCLGFVEIRKWHKSTHKEEQR